MAVPERESGLENIMAEVDRLAGRLEELLQFVRSPEPRGLPLDLNTVLRGALQAMAWRLAEARVTVHEQLATALPVIIGDRLQLERVFVNLIDNGIEAMTGRGGAITLATGTLARSVGSLRVFATVHDTGAGIPPREISRIFDLFFTTKARSAGLGLSIAKKFIEAHGGNVAVWTQPGAGSTFQVTLPVGASG